MSERCLAVNHGQPGVLLTLFAVRSRRHSYHSQADSAGSIPVTRSTREKRCRTSKSDARPSPRDDVRCHLNCPSNQLPTVRAGRSSPPTCCRNLAGPSKSRRLTPGAAASVITVNLVRKDSLAVVFRPRRGARLTRVASAQRMIDVGEAYCAFGALIEVRNLPAMLTPTRRTCS